MEGRATTGAPMRTCIGCRRRAAKSDLLRVVAVRNGPATVLLPDRPGRMPGRGAYVHLDPGCLDLAVRRRAFVRALRLVEQPDPRAVQAFVEDDPAAHPGR